MKALSVVLALLLNFFKSDPGTSRWFLTQGEAGKAVALPQ